MFHIYVILWRSWITSTIWLLILSSTSFTVGSLRVFYIYSSWHICRWFSWVLPGSTGRFHKDDVAHDHSAHGYYITNPTTPTIHHRPKLFIRCPPQQFIFFFHFYFRAQLVRRFHPQQPSGQAVVTGVVPSPPLYVPSRFIAHRVQHSHCSSIFIECF